MTDRPVYLFDACALVAILLGEQGGADAGRLLSAGHACRTTVVIVAEAAYVLLRAGAPVVELGTDIDRLGLTLAAVPDECGMLAADLRRRHPGLSTADALHLATARALGLVLVTSDGPLLLAAHVDGIATHVIANSAGHLWAPPTST